jgi:ribosomal protein S18 acetylase RimI-like enzyme
MHYYEVVPLAETQIETAAHLLAQALANDPLFAYALPDEAERASRLPAFLARNLFYGLLYGQAFTTAGNVLGAAVWLPPGSDVTPERAASAGYNQLSSILGREALLKIGQALDHLNDGHHRAFAPDHWYLTVVGVDPARQRQGIGRALVQAGVAQAAAAGLPCYLDTAAPENLPFYEQLGFRVLVDSPIPDTNLHFWTMALDP